MDFYEMLEKVIELLQRHGRLSYRALKVQFELDDDRLQLLKDELIDIQRVARDHDGKMLVWIADPAAQEPGAQRQPDAEDRLHAMLPAMIALLRHQGRVTYRTLQYAFGIDPTLLEEIRTELGLRRLAIDEGDEVLVWTGESQPAVQPVMAIPTQPVTAVPIPPSETKALTPSSEPTTPTDAVTTGSLQNESASAPEPTRTAPDAERRQLTVMFCDLADSTTLSQQLDPEDRHEVVRAYQATAAEVIHQYDGHMAQYLGDGLLIYFGWPVAHEDDTQRAAHAGLGIVEAVTTDR